MSAGWPLEMLSMFTFEELADGKTRLTIRWSPYNATEEEQKTFDAESVVDAHEHDPVAREPRAPIPRGGVAARWNADARDPHQDGEVRRAGIRREDVEVEAVLAGADRHGDEGELLRRLQSGCAVGEGVTRAVPSGGEPGGPEAPVPSGGRIGSEEHGDTTLGAASNLPVMGGHDGCFVSIRCAPRPGCAGRSRGRRPSGVPLRSVSRSK
jgi:hypothetical protein